MMTPEQIDAALGALQQQIDDLRADTKPEPDFSQIPCAGCAFSLVNREDRPQCTNCLTWNGYGATHHDPAVAQLQRAVKQAGERLAELEEIHADCTPPEGSIGHDFLCDRLDAIDKRLEELGNVAGETPRELRDRLNRHVSNSNHWLRTVEERVTALEDNAHTPVENDLSRIQALEQIHADGMPQTSQCTTCGNAPAYWRWRKPWDASRWLCDGCFEGHRTPTAAADFPPIATQEQVAAAYADRFAVAPSLKQRFSDWIDARTAQGIETYGGPLTTNNGRDAERDMLEEMLDFSQYQEQSRQELLAALRD